MLIDAVVAITMGANQGESFTPICYTSVPKDPLNCLLPNVNVEGPNNKFSGLNIPFGENRIT